MNNKIGKNFGLIERNDFKGEGYVIKYTLKINIAPSGTTYTNINGDQSKSAFGHVWVEFNGESIGWGTGDSKMAGGAENLTFHDSKGYDSTKVTSITLPLYADEVAGNIKGFISEMKEGNYKHFPNNYNLLTNNCIDFVNHILSLSEIGENNPDYMLELFGGTPNEIIERIQEHIDEQESVETPLVIALSGDGIFTLPDDDTIYFDHNTDGVNESTGWITNSSAFLVLDKNKNGIIDNGNEMFGNNTLLESGEYARQGFDALSNYDGNGDGKIDSQDEMWSFLSLWHDKNVNGKTDIDELIKIEQSEIKSIDLNYQENGMTDESGNKFLLTSSVLWDNGNYTEISDILFNTHLNGQSKNLTIDEGTLWL
ncbi:hypothetical protein [Xenorhabdus szentirmaii]|uniref:hypothetical protein n=2 Tax=Xenorhabdus szentirmaii TaxID=290112 RepID=UPI0019A70323|nr:MULTISPECIES: hypothetical protein [unclassified Xenorhabdus]MBD2792578.1 hypothetical protein [Xenorhabdus sp. CUL]MBD2803587.1 hypothetical protein [Xenorhabdus sp. ZM]MBD2823499.1 hypothetical protein [Xenorhabdus sp. 5]